MKILFCLIFPAMSAFFLIISIKVLSRKKPFFFSAKWLFAFMVIAFSPMLINSFRILFKHGLEVESLIVLLSPFMFFVLLSFFWIQMKGYVAIGITDDTFQDALHYALNELKIKFEESLSRLKLPELNCELQVSIQSWIGTGQIKLKKHSDEVSLKGIVEKMDTYYKDNNINANKITAIFYLIMGVLMLLFSIGFLFLDF